MIVVAPVIWTTGVAFLTPLFTEMLSTRYDFDLVPYYPLVLTAFLLLTSIIIVGGLGAFLVLDEVDAGTLTALNAPHAESRYATSSPIGHSRSSW